MGVFDDHKFEQLDWMTQITETIESELNTVLAKLPDRVEFDASTLLRCLHPSGYGSISVGAELRALFTALGMKCLPYQEQDKLNKCFKFEITDDLELDASNGTMKGKVFLVKVVPTLEDEELQQLLGLSGIEKVRHMRTYENFSFERANEVLDILGSCEEAMRTRSARKKIHAMANRLQTIFKTNEWRIRDATLANKVGFWIEDYVERGKLASFTNLCKLKVMTHNSMPIYSVKEEI